MASLFDEGFHHCAIFSVDDHGANHRSFRQCNLNPGHEKFLTVQEFSKKTPSELHLEDEHVPDVWNIVDRTVRIVVSRTSTERPDTYFNSNNLYPCINKRGSDHWVRYGTGYVVEGLNIGGEMLGIDAEEPCHCIACHTSICQAPNKESYYFKIITATHVIFDKQEAQGAVFELFYDSEEREGVEYLYGVTVLGAYFDRLQTDKCHMVCVTHDKRLAERLDKTCNRKRGLPISVLVSHPHGVSKRISIGEFLQNGCVLIHTKDSVKMKKGSQVSFSNCPDGTRMMAFINNRHKDQEPVIDFLDNDDDDGHKTLRFLCDVTIYFPTGIVAESDIEADSSFTELVENRWWRLPVGVELVMDNGRRYTLPESQGNGRDVRMEIFVKGSSFCDNTRTGPCGLRLFIHSTYDMASCPGSSGALIYSHFRRYGVFRSRGKVHFGALGNSNTSGLDRPRNYRFYHSAPTF